MPRPKPATDDLSFEPLETRLLLSVDPLQLAPLAGDPVESGFDPRAGNQVVFQAYVSSPVNDPLQRVTALAATDEAAVCQQLESGLTALRGALPDFAKRFDLHTLNLPVLPSTLDQLFGLSTKVADAGSSLLPDIGSSTTLAQLVESLTHAGYEVTGVQGGMADRQIPDTTGGALIEARLKPGAGVTAAPAAGSSATFNAASDSLLKGLGSVTAASANWDTTTSATVGLSVVFGVDAEGFFVRTEGLALSAAVKGSASLSGQADVAGQKDVSLGGTAAVDATVRLAMPTAAATLRIGELSSRFATAEITETWSGTTDAKLAFTLAPAALTFEAGYTGALTDTAPQAPTLKHSGVLTLANVHDAGGHALKLDLTGKVNDAGGWDLDAKQASGQELTFHEFALKDLTIALTVDATSFTARSETAGTLTLQTANEVFTRLIPEWMSLDQLSGSVDWATLTGERADLAVTVGGSFEALLPETHVGFSGKLVGLTFAVHDGALQLQSLDEFEANLPKVNLSETATLEGEVKFKLLRLDADGKVIADGDITTPIKTSMLYGLLLGTLKIQGYGIQFRVGLAEVGLISAYLRIDAPLPVGGETGLSITSLAGAVSFGKELSVPADAKSFSLDSDVKTVATMSDKEWEKACEEALVKALEPGSARDAFKALLSHFTIEGDISIADIYAKNALYIDGSVQLDTAGHMIVGGKLNLLKLPKKTEGTVEGGKPTSLAQLESKLFFNLAELRKVFDSGPAPQKALMIYADVTNTHLKVPPVTIYGDLAISGLAEENPSIVVSGGVRLSADGYANLEFDSTSTFRALDSTHYEFEIDGKAVVTGFGEFAAMDGLLKVDVDDQGILQIYGGLAVKPENVQKLTHIGVDADAVLLWRVNFTNDARQVTLHLPGDTNDYALDLPAASIGMLIEGAITLNQLKSNWLVLHGAASLYETTAPSSLDIVFDGQVLFGPSGRIDPATQQADALLIFTTQGLLHLDLYGVAGELTLQQHTGSTFKALGVNAGTDVVLRLNTSGHNVTHSFPSAVKQLYPALVVPDQINLPGVPPEILGGHEGDAGAAWAYAGVTGSLVFGDTTVINGDFALVAATDRLEIRLDRAVVNLGAPDNRLLQLTASGSLLVDANGAVGALTVDLPQSNIVGDVLQFTGTAKWLINTTQSAHDLIDGTHVPASIDGNPYSELVIDGVLALNAPTAGFGTLTGHHSLRIVSNAGGPGYHVALSSSGDLVVNTAGATFFTGTFAGAGYIDETGLATFFTLQDNTLGEWLGLSHTFASLSLGVNTTAHNLAVTKSGADYVFTARDSTAPGEGDLVVLPSRVGAQMAAREEVALFDSFRIDGGWTFTLDDNVWSLAIDGDFELHAPSAVVPDGKDKVLVRTAISKTFTLTLPGIVFEEQIDLAKATLDLPGLVSAGALSLVVNTTKTDFAGRTGPYAALTMQSAALHVDGFDLSGGLTFEQHGLSALSTSGDFDVELKIVGETLLNASGTAELHFGFDGLAGRVILAKPTLVGLEFQSPSEAGREFFHLDFNTSSSEFALLNGDTLEAGPYAVAHINSTLTFAAFQPFVLDGEFNLDSTGQLQVDASFNAYLLDRDITPKPVMTLAVKGSLTHTAQSTTGSLELKEQTTQGGFDFPESWGISLGDQHESASFEFNVQHGGSASGAALEAVTEAGQPLKDGVRVVLVSRMVVGPQQINGTFAFTWERGQELIIAAEGSTYVGFGKLDATGKPEVVLMDLHVTGIIFVKPNGILVGFEAAFRVGSEQPKLMTDLGLNEGLGAQAKVYLRINTTGAAAPDVPGIDLSGFSADEKFAVYIGGSLKISSFELKGTFAFTLFEDGFLLQAVAEHSLSLIESTGSDHSAGTNLTLTDSQVTGFLEVRRDGVVGFFTARVDILEVEIAGFALNKDEVDGYIRINTTGKAVDVSKLGADVPVTLDPSFKELPAGHYAQLILDAKWTSPPFIGIQFDDWLLIEIVDNMFVLSGQVSVKAELFNFEGVSADLFRAKADMVAVITKDRGFALAGVLDVNPLSSLKSEFFNTDLDTDVQASLQIKTLEGALDLTKLIPARLTQGVSAVFQFEEGSYAKIHTQTSLEAVTLGVGVTMSGDTTLEFKHELIAPGANGAPAKYRTWLEAVIHDEVTTKLSTLGSLTDSDTLAFYVGSDGLAFLLERDEVKSPALKLASFDFALNTLKLGFNTTGRDIAIDGKTISRDQVELVINGALEAGVLALTGDYTFDKQSDHFDVTSEAKLLSLNTTVADVKLTGLLGLDHFSVTASGELDIGEKPVAALDGTVTVGLDTKTGFSGALAGEFWFLDRQVKSVSESFQSTGIDVAFAYDLSVPLPGPMSFVALAGRVSGHITNQGITVDDRVTVKVHNTSVNQVALKLDTIAKTWSLDDRISLSLAKVKIGPAEVAVDLDFDFHVAYAHGALTPDSGVTLSGKASATVKGHGVSVDRSLALTRDAARISFPLKIHVPVLGTLFQHTVSIDLTKSSLIQGSDLGGSSIFLDTNGNGQLDAGEVSVEADGNGFFTFSDPTDPGPLGRLSPFDRDRDGQIDPDEGVFVVQGGTDQNNGLPNPLQFAFSAEDYDSPFQVVYSPLLQLHADLVRHEGLGSDEAWSKIHVAFGLPSWIAVGFFDHNLDEANFGDEGAYRAVEAAYAKINALLINGGAVLHESQPGHSHAEIEAALRDQLAHAVAQQDTAAYDAALDDTGTFEPASPALRLDDPATADAIIGAALAELGGTTGTEAPPSTISAAADAIAEQSRFIDLLRTAGVDQFTEAMAMVKAEAQQGTSAQLREIARGEVHAGAFVEAYGRESIEAAIVRQGFDPSALAPVIGTIPDFAGTPAELREFVLSVSRFDESVDPLVWQIASSDEALLPVDRIQLVEHNGQWTLKLNPDAALRGTVAVTLVATDTLGHASADTTVSLQLLPLVSVGAVRPVVTSDAAYFEVPITLDAPSNEAITGTYRLAGAAVEQGLIEGASGTFTIAAGQSAGTLSIPYLRTPFGEAAAFTVAIENLANARGKTGVESVQSSVPSIPLPGGTRAAHPAGFTARSLALPGESLVRAIRSDPNQPDTDRIVPDKLHYRG